VYPEVVPAGEQPYPQGQSGQHESRPGGCPATPDLHERRPDPSHGAEKQRETHSAEVAPEEPPPDRPVRPGRVGRTGPRVLEEAPGDRVNAADQQRRKAEGDSDCTQKRPGNEQRGPGQRPPGVVDPPGAQ